MTPDKTFRMKSQTKNLIALMKGTRENRNQFKKMMIDAQLYEEAADRAAKKSKGSEENKGRGRGAVAPE